jgi:hypothetical protein
MHILGAKKMGLNDEFAFYNYDSDDGSSYAVKLSAKVATAGNFGAAVNPLTSVCWPFDAKNMRKVYGVNAGGKRTHLPIANPGNGLYMTGGTFTLAGGVYTGQGAIGERRSLSAIG